MSQQSYEARMHAIRRMLTKASSFITDDAQASTVPTLFPYWAKDDWADYTLGRIVRMRDGTLWKMNQPALTDASQNLEPGSSEAIWSQVAYKNGVRIIPDVITSTLAFALDELGWWHGSAAAQEGVYKSGQAGNSFPPGTQGAKWTYVGSDAADGQGDGGETTEPEPPTEPEPETPAIPKAWDDFPANHAFQPGDEFSDGGTAYVVKRAFYKQDHMRPPALTGDYYVVRT